MLVDEGYETAKRILTEQAEDLGAAGPGLLEYETLTGDEIQKVIAGEPLNRDEDEDTPPPPGNLPSVTAIPKTGRPKPGPDMEPEPS
jgi:cell division protease FtsH